MTFSDTFFFRSFHLGEVMRSRLSPDFSSHKNLFYSIFEILKSVIKHEDPQVAKKMVRFAKQHTKPCRLNDSGSIVDARKLNRPDYSSRLVLILPGESPPLPSGMDNKTIHFDLDRKITYLRFHSEWNLWTVKILCHAMFITWYRLGFVKAKHGQYRGFSDLPKTVPAITAFARLETWPLVNECTHEKARINLNLVMRNCGKFKQNFGHNVTLPLPHLTTLLSSAPSPLTEYDEISWFLNEMVEYAVAGTYRHQRHYLETVAGVTTSHLQN